MSADKPATDSTTTDDPQTTVSMRTFLADPKPWIEQVLHTGKPVFLTLVGTIVLVINQIDDQKLMTQVLSMNPIAEQLARRMANKGPGITTDKMLQEADKDNGS